MKHGIGKIVENTTQNIVVICSTISICYGYQAWHSQIKPALDESKVYSPYAKGTIEGSSLISSLLMLRRMHDFLSGNRSKDDDLVCTDLKLSAQCLLTDNERMDINKRVAHLTTATEFDDDFDRNLLTMYQRIYPILETVLTELSEIYSEKSKIARIEIHQTIRFIQDMNRRMEEAVQH